MVSLRHQNTRVRRSPEDGANAMVHGIVETGRRKLNVVRSIPLQRQITLPSVAKGT